MSSLHPEGDLAVVERQIDEWLAAFRHEHDEVVADIQRGEGDERRWYVRMRGTEKDVTTVWLLLGQRTLKYETYFVAVPEENHAAFYEHLLRRNDKLVGAHFSIGIEDAVFLRGEIALAALDQEELDRILGSLYAYVEQYFRPALRIGFASRFTACRLRRWWPVHGLRRGLRRGVDHRVGVVAVRGCTRRAAGERGALLHEQVRPRAS